MNDALNLLKSMREQRIHPAQASVIISLADEDKYFADLSLASGVGMLSLQTQIKALSKRGLISRQTTAPSKTGTGPGAPKTIKYSLTGAGKDVLKALIQDNDQES